MIVANDTLESLSERQDERQKHQIKSANQNPSIYIFLICRHICLAQLLTERYCSSVRMLTSLLLVIVPSSYRPVSRQPPAGSNIMMHLYQPNTAGKTKYGAWGDQKRLKLDIQEWVKWGFTVPDHFSNTVHHSARSSASWSELCSFMYYKCVRDQNIPCRKPKAWQVITTRCAWWCSNWKHWVNVCSPHVRQQTPLWIKWMLWQPLLNQKKKKPHCD